jgi:hypothetical protein
MIEYIDTDDLGTQYYVLDFTIECGLALPWGEAMFDCQIFPPGVKTSSALASLISSLPYEHIDWVHTAEPNSEYWHDEVDRASVRRGVQQQVGDGKPMTAWFNDLLSVNDWKQSYNLGASPHFLFVFVEPTTPLQERVDVLRRKIRVR